MDEREKSPAGTYTALPQTLPPNNIPNHIDPVPIAQECIQKLGSTLLENTLTEAIIWRDLFSFTGTLRTFYGASSVASIWTKLARIHNPHSFELLVENVQVLKFGDPVCHSWIEAPFVFKTRSILPAECSGFLSITPCPDGEWKIWSIRTMLENFERLGNVDSCEGRLLNGDLVSDRSLENDANGTSSDHEFEVIIVGGGQAGLSIAGRLNALKVSNVVLEANDKVGGNWSSRYDSAKLHLPKENGHLPFDRSFLEDDPEMLPIKSLASAFERYVDRYDINIRLSSRVEKAQWDKDKKRWTVRATHYSDHMEYRGAHLVIANGMSIRTPFTPDIPDKSLFRGKVLHGTQYKNAKDWKGLRGVVVGTANTAHDVAMDMVDAGLSSVTMIQRNSTYVFPVSHIFKAFVPIWNADLPTSLSDKLVFTQPHAISRLLVNLEMHALAHADTAYYDAIRRTPFNVTQYSDINSHLYGTARIGGHYIDVGNMANIVSGKVGVKSRARIERFTPSGLRFEDGEEVEADVVVFATGYRNDVREATERLCGEEVAGLMDEYWGVDTEGEVRGAWKPNGHERLWYMGGPIAECRFFSRFVALSIKAAVMGKPMPVYRENLGKVC